MNSANAVVFLDTETTGLDPVYDGIWEVAYIRREHSTGTETRDEFFVHHDVNRAMKLPEPFLTDYLRRFDPNKALTRQAAAEKLGDVFHDRPHVVGAVPDFDTTRIALLGSRFQVQMKWHYHLIDVETLVAGHLLALVALGDVLDDRAGAILGRSEKQREELRTMLALADLNSDALSLAIGVDPARFNRHQAMGDVEWCRAQYDVVHSPVMRADSLARINPGRRAQQRQAIGRRLGFDEDGL